MLDICGIDNSVMPKLFESYEVVGAVLPTVAKELGLSSNCVVTAGAGDNAAAAIGTGTLGNGRCNLSLGTSGTIFISSDHYIPMEHPELHSFCHAMAITTLYCIQLLPLLIAGGLHFKI